MTHRKGAIWTERLLLGLILISLAATLNLLLAIHRRAPGEEQGPVPAVALKPAAESRQETGAPAEEPAPADKAIVAETSQPEAPEPPPEDPTKKAIASLAAATAKESKAALETDQRSQAMAAGYRAAVAESDRWKRREMLVRQQIASITAHALKLEREADLLDAERDVLERERDATKAALAKATARSGFAVLPYKGPNGTWRRPIVVECTAGGAKLQPRGPSFTALELSPRIQPRLSLFVRAIAQELGHIRSADTPDGTPAVPYIVFLVRPDGIGPYYLARTSLEPLGIAFGYELVDQKVAVNIPDYDDLTTWDGTMPLDMPLQPAPGALSGTNELAHSVDERRQSTSDVAGRARGDQTSVIGSLAAPRTRGQQRGEGGSGSGDAEQPEDFVWPGRSRGAGRGGEGSGNQVAAADSGSLGAPGSSNARDEPGRAGGSDLLPIDPRIGISGNKSNAEDIGTERGNGGFLAAAPGGPGSGFVPAGSGTGSGNAEDIGTAAIAGQLPASAASGLDGGENPGGSDAGLSASNGNALGTGAGNRPGGFVAAAPGGPALGSSENRGGSGAGRTEGTGNAAEIGGGNRPGGFVAAAPGGPGLGDRLGARGAGSKTGSSASSDDAKASEGADPADQPFPAGGAGVGGTGAIAGQRMPGAGSRATDGVITLPDFEPAKDPPGGLSVPAQNELASGAGAGGGPDAQAVSRSAKSNLNNTETTPGGVPGQKGNRSDTSADQIASGNGSGGPPDGFDWDAAAQGRLPAAGVGGTATDPALGAQAMDDQASAQPRAASSANVAPGRAIGQASDSATAQPGLQGGAIPPGQFSQDDANRASALAGLSSLMSPGLAQQLAGTMSGSSSPSGMPSTLPPSSSNSTNQSGGMPLGSDTQSSTSSSSSNSSLSQFTLPNSSASSDEANALIMPPRPKQIPPEGAIDVRFEIVVVCRKDEVILQPGNYRMTGAVLRSGGQGADCMLAREIRAMVRNREIIDPLIRQKPAIRFLVENQGADTFALARRQILFSLPDWPVALQVAGAHNTSILSRNQW